MSRGVVTPVGTVEQGEKLYEGKAKIVYATKKPGVVIQYFKDDATAFNAVKKGTIVGKGVVNNRMSATLFERLGPAELKACFDPLWYLRNVAAVFRRAGLEGPQEDHQ